ncbi:MAG: DUF1513 domain-containing protein [Litorilituus sp.]|jgi:hypothetical protein|nr:DUF1513 domain-containing protein [Litorilituus sp.]
MISRRQFLFAIAAAGTAATMGCTPLFSTQKYWLVSACSNKNNEHFVAAFDLQGQIISKIKLPARGHDAIAIPEKPGHALIFARRPGTFVLEVDFIQGKITQQIEAQSHSHFYGHGIISPKHNVLLTSENDFATGHGKIVVRDTENYQVLEQFDSGGIGPHQLALMPNNNTIVIANGGIKTHPAQPRKKLNINTMSSNLAYLELASGNIIDSYTLDNHKLSIRHLAVSKTGNVIAGLQYQGAKNDLVPLAISHHGENALQYLSADEDIWRRMNQYTASVCIDDNRDLIAISCPRADMITYWSLTRGEYLTNEKFTDGAGLTQIDKIYATSGKGRLIASKTANSDAQKRLELGFSDLKWDNHLTSIRV